MLVLGIETSCDETAASVVKDGKKILSNVVASQIEIHKPYGGVVPELASRRHIELIIPVIKETLKKAKILLTDVNAIAVTKGPGLVGSLLVGIGAAKAIAFVKSLPIIGVNHIEAHLYINLIEHPNLKFPVLGLIGSGGHTELIKWSGFDKYEPIGRTRDDAVGEAFDKVAKLLELPYPGGPSIEKLSNEPTDEFSTKVFKFPKAIMKDGSLDFSFSGLKTAVLYKVKKEKRINKKEIAKAFQDAAVNALIETSLKAASAYKLKTIVFGGGVAANNHLRKEFQIRGKKENVDVIFPSKEFCTDNAAMIAIAGYYKLKKGQKDDWSLDADSSLQIGRGTL